MGRKTGGIMFVRLLKILALILIAGVAGAEVYGRYVLKLRPGLQDNHLAEALAKFAIYDPRLGLAYRVNIDQLIDSPYRDFSVLYKTNEIGLRDRPMGTHLRQELKFLVFGDEFTEGWGADIDQTFVVQTQQIVNTRTALKPPIRTVIAGKSGYGVAQNYLAAEALIDALQPKAIVFVYTALMPHADAMFLQDATVADGLATGLKAAEAPVRLPHLEDYPAAPPAWLKSLAAHSVAARLFAQWQGQRAIRTKMAAGDPLSDRLAGIRGGDVDLAAVHAPSLRHVRALAELAKRRNIPFLLVHLPLPPQVSAETWPVGRQLFAVEAGVVPARDVEVVAAFCRDAGIRCLSLHETLREAAGKLQSAQLYQPAEIALTLEGSNLVARWLADEL